MLNATLECPHALSHEVFAYIYKKKIYIYIYILIIKINK